MRALTVVSLLVLAAPALADTPPPPAPPAATAPPAEAAATPADAAPPAAAAPITPPALVPPIGAPPADLADDDAPPTKYGYRVQVIAADAAVIALSLAVDRLAADAGRPDALATLTIASYFFAAPMV